MTDFALGAAGLAVGADYAIGGPDDWDAYLSGPLADQLGFEDMSLIGASDPNLRNLENSMGRLRNIDPQALLIRREVARRRRILDLGIPVTSVTTGATPTLRIQTQRTFRTERVYVDDSVAEFFNVSQAFVGQNSQFAGADPVSAAGWSNKTFDPKGVLWDTANPGLFITLTITNTDANTHVFKGSFRGTSTVR